MNYRKKPVVIQAVLYNGTNAEEIYKKLGTGFTDYGYYLSIPTLEGTMNATPGDWIIKGVKGELYPCKNDIFAATYEPEEAGQVDKKITKTTLLSLCEEAKNKALPLTWLTKQIEEL